MLLDYALKYPEFYFNNIYIIYHISEIKMYSLNIYIYINTDPIKLFYFIMY